MVCCVVCVYVCVCVCVCDVGDAELLWCADSLWHAVTITQPYLCSPSADSLRQPALLCPQLHHSPSAVHVCVCVCVCMCASCMSGSDIFRIFLNAAESDEFISFAPAIHLLRLKVASILEQLNIIEEEADHPFCFLQICLHLCRVLSRFPRAQHPHILQRTDTRSYSSARRCEHFCQNQINVVLKQKGLRLTVCSRGSTWLSCSSQTPDSIWTLLTTRWSRSILQWERKEVRGQKAH